MVCLHSVRCFMVADYMTSAAWFVAILCAVGVALCSLIIVCIRQNRGGKYPVKKKEAASAAVVDADEERQFMEYQYGGCGSGSGDFVKEAYT